MVRHVTMLRGLEQHHQWHDYVVFQGVTGHHAMATPLGALIASPQVLQAGDGIRNAVFAHEAVHVRWSHYHGAASTIVAVVLVRPFLPGALQGILLVTGLALLVASYQIRGGLLVVGMLVALELGGGLEMMAYMVTTTLAMLFVTTFIMELVGDMGASRRFDQRPTLELLDQGWPFPYAHLPDKARAWISDRYSGRRAIQTS